MGIENIRNNTINIYVSIIFYHYIASPRLRFCEWILSPGSTLTGHRQGLDTTSALRASEGEKEKRIRLKNRPQNRVFSEGY